MKNFTYKFELFGKKAKFICSAIDRKRADEEFCNMLLKHTKFDSVTEENPVIKEKNFMTDFDNIFKNFSSSFDFFK